MAEFDFVDPHNASISFPSLRARQPVGDVFLATIPHDDLIRLTYFDVRRVLKEERDFENYLGIQRPLDPQRVGALSKYVNFADASFPTSVIIAIDSEYASFDDDENLLTIRNHRVGEESPSTILRNIARVLDGQHRIAGLRYFEGEKFDLSVTVFIGADIADQAQIFATVNLEQTKVSKSLVYDLFELAKTRSPQKVCHNVAVTLNRDPSSPLHHRIKRLGIATEKGRFEPITQSTFVESIMPYVSLDPKVDRDILMRGGTVQTYETERERRICVLRHLFAAEKDFDIVQVFFNYFSAIAERWPVAWETHEQGKMLNRTNGMRAFLRFFRDAYPKVGKIVPSTADFLSVFAGVDISDGQFSTEYFAPGTSGEARLYRVLIGDEALTPLEPAAVV
jgi:DGQHR domain-containing protein